jgi:hypothetical protein
VSGAVSRVELFAMIAKTKHERLIIIPSYAIERFTLAMPRLEDRQLPLKNVRKAPSLK